MKGGSLPMKMRIGNLSLPTYALRLLVRRSQIAAGTPTSRLAPQHRPHIESTVLPQRRRQPKHKPMATNAATDASGESG